MPQINSRIEAKKKKIEKAKHIKHKLKRAKEKEMFNNDKVCSPIAQASPVR